MLPCWKKKSGGGGGFMGNASASLSLDGTLSNILAMKLTAVSFFPVITSSLASQSHQWKSGILLQEGPQI